MIVDVNGVSDVGITSFANRRVDTRTVGEPARACRRACSASRCRRPPAARPSSGSSPSTVSPSAGYVTAYGCDDGIPTDGDGHQPIRPQLRPGTRHRWRPTG